MGVFDIFRSRNARFGTDGMPQPTALPVGVSGEEPVFAASGSDAFTEFCPSQYGDSMQGPLLAQGDTEERLPFIQPEQRARQRVNARPGTRVLIIDESAAIVRGLRRLMRQNELEPIEGLGSQRGLELAFTARPQLIFLAVAMQGQSGFNILRMLRRDERTRHVPVIMMSANAHATEADYVRRLGADGFVIKPFSRADIFQRIERLLDPARVPRRSAESMTAS